MQPEAQIKQGKTGECRALVPLTANAGTGPRLCPRANAAFVTQLAASEKGFAQYRAKRRISPETGAMRYRTTIAGALAFRPNGRKLNYCA
jgi:hypothetical protein